MGNSSQEGWSQSRNPSPSRDRFRAASQTSYEASCPGLFGDPVYWTELLPGWAMAFRDDEPWTHHRLCGIHLVCHPSGAVCEVCRDWSAEIWKAFKVKDLQLQKKQDYRADNKKPGETSSQSPAKAREPVPPVPEPILVDSPAPAGA